MRFLALLIVVSMSGCVTELLGNPEVNTRALVCEAFDGPLEIVHHGKTGLDEDTRAWAVDVARVREEGLSRFSWSYRDAVDPTPTWAEDQSVFGDKTRIHVVWGDEPEVVRMVNPAVVSVNGSVGNERALLFHALGHTLGVVNLGVPLHDPAGPTREVPAGHAPGGPMSVRWHDPENFPDVPIVYSQDTILDWQSYIADPRMCS